MKRAALITFGIFGLGIVLFGLYLGFVFSTPMFDCSNELLSAARSPNGKLAAVAFERNCGATTKYSLQISILNGREPLIDDDRGNALRAEDLSRQGYRVEWKGDDQLVIHFSEKPEIFLQEKEVRGVKISYEPA